MKSKRPLLSSIALTLAFVASAAGDPTIDAPLKKFNGRIDYNATQPNAAKAALEVDTGSLDMGSKDYDAEVRKKEWLDSTTYPQARLISTSVKPGAAGHFDATGTLTMKGKTQTMT